MLKSRACASVQYETESIDVMLHVSLFKDTNCLVTNAVMSIYTSAHICVNAFYKVFQEKNKNWEIPVFSVKVFSEIFHTIILCFI